VLPQHRLLQLPQLRAGLDAELVHVQLARLAVELERVGLPPGAVQREHQERAWTLTQRLARDQLLELRNDRLARLDRRVEPVFVRLHPQLLEMCGDGLRRSAPERKRFFVPALATQLLEAVEVELALLDAQRVTGRARDEPVGAERL